MKSIFKYDYQDYMLFITVFLFWFSIQFGRVVEDSIAYILVVSVGIMHGSNDLLILSKNEKNKHRLIKKIFFYLGIILSCIVVFFIDAYIAILLFIVLSSYHFGEEHFGEKVHETASFNTVFFISYGLFLFSLLFYETMQDVDLIMNQLTGKTFGKLHIEISLMLSGLVLIAMSLYLWLKKKAPKINFVRELFYLALLFLVFKTSSLILSFAIYFIFWHSIPSIIHQTKFLSGQVSSASVVNYFKKAAVFWLISIAGLAGLYFIFPDLTEFATVIFAVLFAVTAPHAWVMHNMKH